MQSAGISEDIIGTVKLICTHAIIRIRREEKLKINVNRGVLRSSTRQYNIPNSLICTLMIIKGKSKENEEEEIDGFLLNGRFNIKEHTAKIFKKLDEYFRKDFGLKKRYFSLKNIIRVGSSKGCVRF